MIQTMVTVFPLSAETTLLTVLIPLTENNFGIFVRTVGTPLSSALKILDGRNLSLSRGLKVNQKILQPVGS